MARSFPTTPVAALLRRMCLEQRIPMAELADRVGLSFRTVRHCLEERMMRESTADRVACALGRHPCELWPEWFSQRSPG